MPSQRSAKVERCADILHYLAMFDGHISTILWFERSCFSNFRAKLVAAVLEKSGVGRWQRFARFSKIPLEKTALFLNLCQFVAFP